MNQDRHPGGAHGGAHPPSSVSSRARRRILGIFFAVSALLVILDLPFMPFHRHVEHPLEQVWVFYPLYGLVGVSALILAAKGLRRIVMRAEDYYDAD